MTVQGQCRRQHTTWLWIGLICSTTTSVLMRTLETPPKLQVMQLMRLATTSTLYWNCWGLSVQEMPDEVYVTATGLSAHEDGGRAEVVWCSGASICWTTYCQQQHTKSLSRARSRVLHEVLNGAARGPLQSKVFQAMDLEAVVRVQTDSSAAAGITQRLGAGRVRHLEVKDVWIQEKVRSHELRDLASEVRRQSRRLVDEVPRPRTTSQTDQATSTECAKNKAAGWQTQWRWELCARCDQSELLQAI